MGEGMSRGWIFIVLLAALAVTASLYSEDLLSKKGAKYLGWQTAKDKFTTCKKKPMEIGDGTIQKTEQKCETPPGPGPFSAQIKNLDVANRMVVLQTRDGSSMTLFYPDLSREEVQNELKEFINSKREVRVSSPVQGRVDSIKIQ